MNLLQTVSSLAEKVIPPLTSFFKITNLQKSSHNPPDVAHVGRIILNGDLLVDGKRLCKLVIFLHKDGEISDLNYLATKVSKPIDVSNGYSARYVKLFSMKTTDFGKEFEKDITRELINSGDLNKFKKVFEGLEEKVIPPSIPFVINNLESGQYHAKDEYIDVVCYLDVDSVSLYTLDFKIYRDGSIKDFYLTRTYDTISTKPDSGFSARYQEFYAMTVKEFGTKYKGIILTLLSKDIERLKKNFQ